MEHRGAKSGEWRIESGGEWGVEDTEWLAEWSVDRTMEREVAEWISK